MKFRSTFWFVLAILGVSAWGAYRTQAEIFYQIIYLGLLLIVTSFISGLLSIKGFEVRRISRESRKEFGQVFEERFEVRNLLPFVRPWLEVKDGSELSGGGGARVLSWFGKRELRNYSAYTLLQKRGNFTLGPTILHSGDLFGLFEFERVLIHNKQLITIPYLADLTVFPYPPGLLPGGKAQRFRSLDVTPHAAGVREYVPGDALKRIHWPSSAKTNKLIVKEFEQNPQASVWLFLDAQQSAHFELPFQPLNARVDQFWLWKHRKEIELPPISFEYCVSIAGSIGKYFLRSGQEVGFACAEKRLHIMNAEHGERQLGKMLELLALVQAEGRMPLQALVEAQIPHIARGSVAVLITPTCSKELLSCVGEIILRDLRPVVVLVDAKTFGGKQVCDLDVMGALRKRNVPTALVRNGDNLKNALETGFELSFYREWGVRYNVKESSRG